MTTAWTGDGADLLADTVGNWDNGIPSSINDAVFDGVGGGSPTKDCTWNIAAMALVDVQPGYTGVITQAIDLVVSGAFSIDSTAGGAAQEWDLAALYTLTVGGKYTDIGIGLGVTNATGSTVKVAGDTAVDRDASVTLNRYNNVIFIGSIADENSINTRTMDWEGGKSLIITGTIRNNQTFTFIGADFSMTNGSIGNGCTMQDDGATKSITIGGLWSGLQHLTFVSTAVNRLQVTLNDLNITGADFGASRVTLTSSSALQGIWVATGDWRFRGSSPLVSSLEAGATIACRGFQIGNESNPGRPTDFTQKANSRIVASGDALLTADDTIQVSRWTREAGALAPLVGGSFTVEAEAALDWAAADGVHEVGANMDIDATAVCNFGTTTTDLKGTGNLSNDTNANNLYGLTAAAAGKVTTVTTKLNMVGGVFSVGGGTFDKGATTVTFEGAAGAQFVGMRETTWLGTGGIIIQMALGDQTVPGGDFNENININIQNDTVGLRTLTTLGAWRTRSVTANTAADKMVTIELGGDWTYDYFHHGNGIGTGSIWNLNGYTVNFGTWSQGGDLSQMNGPGLVECVLMINRTGTALDYSGFTTVASSDHIVEVGGTFNHGSGDVTMKGSLLPVGDLIFGTGRYKYYETFDASGANSVVYGTAALVLGGPNGQATHIYAGSPYSLRNEKTAGTTTFTVGFTLIDAYYSRPRANINTDFTVGQVFTINRFDFDNRSAFKETLDSSDSVTPVAITSAVVGPTGRNTDVGRLTLSTGLQDMDDNTCADLGGNTNFNFASLPLPVYSSSMAGMGLGLGLGHLKEQQP